MSNVPVSNEAIVPNAKRLLWAGFLAIFAAGMGFGIRGGIFDNWAGEFGFTATQLSISLSKALSILSQTSSFSGTSVELRYRKDY